MKKTTDSGCRDRALLVLGSNTAKQAALTALLDPNAHSRPPLTHTSHHRPALVNLSRFIAVSGVTHSRVRRFSTCFSAVSGVSLVGVSLLSADVAAAVVRPEVISQRVLIPEVEQGPIGKLSSRRTRSCNNPESVEKFHMRLYVPPPLFSRSAASRSWLLCPPVRLSRPLDQSYCAPRCEGLQ
jgi:hypothetical protein